MEILVFGSNDDCKDQENRLAFGFDDYAWRRGQISLYRGYFVDRWLGASCDLQGHQARSLGIFERAQLSLQHCIACFNAFRQVICIFLGP